MTLAVRTGRNGTLTVRASGKGGLYTVSPEEDGRICHIRGPEGRYIATAEWDREIRRSMIFNVYMGEERRGTIAAAARAVMEEGSLPILSFSWNGLSFDGRVLSESMDGPESGRRRRVAEFRKGFGGTRRIRMAEYCTEEDLTNAVLALTAALAWVRIRSAH